MPSPWTRYVVTAAVPAGPPAASETTTSPERSKPKPYGAAPVATVVTAEPRRPSPATVKVSMVLLPFSVTTSRLPSGVKETCSGEMAPAESAEVASAALSGRSPPSPSQRPETELLPALRTSTSCPQTVTLMGSVPPDEAVLRRWRSPAPSTAKADTVSEAALTASRRCPECASASAPWDPSAEPVPSPPVAKLATGMT